MRDLTTLSDTAVADGLTASLSRERAHLADSLRFMGEYDARRLYARAGFESIYKYCEMKGMGGDEAYLRLKAARLGRRFPEALDMIAAETTTMSALKVIAPVLEE